jgi:DNA invertase Pin-like site-specific DNA recombinase
MKVGCLMSNAGQRKFFKTWLRNQGIPVKDVCWYSPTSTGDYATVAQLDADVSARKLGTVVCVSVGDIGGRLRVGVDRLKSWTDSGTKVVFINEEIELTGKTGQTVVQMLAKLYESEEEYIRKKHKAGVSRAKREGKYKGRPKGITKQNPEKAIELRDDGWTVEQIAEELGVSPRTVFRYLGKEAA